MYSSRVSVSHVLLGILAGRPAHGYEVKREHDARFPGSRSLAFGQVYASLARLQRDGLVTVSTTEPGGGPERTVYAISAAGRAALAGWLSTVEPGGPYPADELVRKVVTALSLGQDSSAFLLGQRRAHLAHMRALHEELAACTAPAQRIAIDHTITHLDADLRWMDEAEARIGRGTGVGT